uniref:Uncharacterized protein n=1 Tax=Vitis vinifera TaxID=29760 RepID=F6HY08_VITVI
MNYFFRVNIQYCSSFVVCFNIDEVQDSNARELQWTIK